jgi:hypothetical protein
MSVEFGQTNLFTLVYHLFRGQEGAGFQATLANFWLLIVVVGYVLSVLGFILIIYLTVRLFELRKQEHHYYTTLITPAGAAAGGANPRWEHIQSLVHTTSASHWREAIIEADIMLDEVLAHRGYVGDGVGGKLKAIEPRELRSLNDAWEVHKIRNQIAHEGSKFDLSATLAQRTIARYESIFRELKVI